MASARTLARAVTGSRPRFAVGAAALFHFRTRERFHIYYSGSGVMSGAATRRAVKRSVRQRFGRSAASAAIVAGLVATGLTLAAIPSPTSATSASVQAGGAATHDAEPAARSTVVS